MRRAPAGPGQESVWDYPRPPRLEPTRKLVVVEFGGLELARTTRALRLLETSHPPSYYIPPEDVRREHLLPAPGTSLCEWKGSARYWSIRIGARESRAAAWSYPDPVAEYAALKDHFAFYASRVDACYVDGERVTPQPGDFYGGWITPDVVGPFKGAPGTFGW